MLELAPGTTLGAYVITARLGRGGMATVYQAHHPALDRNVAIKVLWPTLAETPGFLERFRREARAASRLRHPHILTVYDFGEHDGIAYMVTELLPGGSLAERLGRPLPYTEILRVLRGIGSALDVAHRAGLIHRDVKPSNILFTRDGEPVLADFGIARLLETEEQNLTVSGTMIGTPHYMAPELATGDEIGPFSDLYSLGVVLYEMLTGELPFQRETPLATIRAHIHEPAPPISEKVRRTSAAVDMVVAQAVAKEPRLRYRSGIALATAFEDALLSDDPPTPRPGSIAPIRPPAPRQTPKPGDTWSGTPPPGAANPGYGRDSYGGVSGSGGGYPQGSSAPGFPPRYPTGSGPFQPRPPADSGRWQGQGASQSDYGEVIPGPPRAAWTNQVSDTERWRQGAAPPRQPRRVWPLALMVVLLIGAAATAGAYVARSRGYELPFSVPDLAGLAATRTPTAPPVVTMTPTRVGSVFGPGGQGTPGAGGSPSPVASATVSAPTPQPSSSPLAADPTGTPTVTPEPSLTPSATPEPPTATPTLDPIRGPLTVQFVSPADGAQVPARPPIIGRKAGAQSPDQHLWLLIHPEGSGDNWWPYKGEVLTERDGSWQITDVEIGGPPGSRHVLAIGVVDEQAHRTMLNQIRTQQDEPFVGGQPPDFQELSRVTVIKR